MNSLSPKILEAGISLQLLPRNEEAAIVSTCQALFEGARIKGKPKLCRGNLALSLIWPWRGETRDSRSTVMLQLSRKGERHIEDCIDKVCEHR